MSRPPPFLILLALAGWGNEVRAEDPGFFDFDRSYAAPVAGVDLLSFVVAGAAGLTDDGACPRRAIALESAGAGIYLLGAPALHLAHGHGWDAGLSLVMRAAPLAVFSLWPSDRDGEPRRFSPLLGGLVVGAIGGLWVAAVPFVEQAIFSHARDPGAPAARLVTFSGTFGETRW